MSRTAQFLDTAKRYAIIIGTSLLVLTACRNTLTRLFRHVWGASGEGWQQLWNYVFNLCGRDEFTLSVYGSMVFSVATFWLVNAAFLFMDLTGKPHFLTRYKIQEDKNVPMDRAKFWGAMRRVFFNTTVFTLPMVWGCYYVMRWRGCDMGAGDLPTFQWVLLDLVAFSLVEEVGFYYSHRLFHHRAIYKYIHKVHHEWTAPICIISVYAHPVEHMISNLGPVLLGPIVMGSHMSTAWLWHLLAMASTAVSHSGYHLPFLPSPEAHDYHHLKFVNNFGVLGILDRLHGTDVMFRESRAYQRHIYLTSATPMTSQVPEPTPSGKAKSE